jgi:hypothetical protein
MQHEQQQQRQQQQVLQQPEVVRFVNFPQQTQQTTSAVPVSMQQQHVRVLRPAVAGPGAAVGTSGMQYRFHPQPTVVQQLLQQQPQQKSTVVQHLLQQQQQPQQKSVLVPRKQPIILPPAASASGQVTSRLNLTLNKCYITLFITARDRRRQALHLEREQRRPADSHTYSGVSGGSISTPDGRTATYSPSTPGKEFGVSEFQQ